MNLLKHPPTDGSISWFDDQHKTYEYLAPGPSLYAMNADVLNSVSDILNPVGSEFETKHFYLWIQEAFTLATSKSLFGAKNPLSEDPKLVEALW